MAFLSAIGLIRKIFGLSECNRVNKENLHLFYKFFIPILMLLISGGVYELRSVNSFFTTSIFSFQLCIHVFTSFDWGPVIKMNLHNNVVYVVQFIKSSSQNHKSPTRESF